MKIEKIKNYNQKVLAILGTLAIILIFVSIIGVGSISLMEFLRFRNYNKNSETGILAEEKVEKLQKEHKRKQVISYQSPKLIDTLNSIYIIPVSHKNLNEAEDIDELLNQTINSKSKDRQYSKQFYGSYNNLIIYNQKNETSHKLFDKRVNFNEINIKYFPDDILLLFNVAENDTYKDGVINLLDFKSLYIYSLNEKKLRKIGNKEMDVVSYKFLDNNKDIFILLGIDKNKNGKYDKFNEPIIIKKYNYKTDEITDIIDPKTNTELQKMIEGTKK